MSDILLLCYNRWLYEHAVPLPSAICKGNRVCRIKTLIAILPCQSVLSYVRILVSGAGAGVRARVGVGDSRNIHMETCLST